MTAVLTALLESKYRIPSRRNGTVARPRLTARLGAAAAVTLLSAPAGFGKTTLLTEWLATVPADSRSIAWLSVDERDNDPGLFWRYVVTAIRAATTEVGEAALQLLGSSAATEAALTALLNDLGRLSKDLVLVLDDYHLIEATAVHEAMTYLIEHQPPGLQLVLGTRLDPALPLARLRAGGQLVQLRAADLRFTADEAATYLNDSMELGLDGGDVAALAGRTEGWIAALQLAALSMQGRDDPGAFIAGFAGDHRYVVDYLAEEVLARQPVGVRNFLLETSVLDRLTGSLCDAVTAGTGGNTTLVALERANLFLVPLDDKREWYRYHHLFADVLRAHLVEERADEGGELHNRASEWFEANGDRSQAINHALAGRDFARAADLMELAMPVMRRERREVELGRWVRVLPDEVVQLRPVLAMAFVGVLAQALDFATIGKRLSDIERSLGSTDGPVPSQPPAHLIVLDAVGYQSLAASIEVYRAALALTSSDLDRAVGHARRALSLTPAEDHLVRAAAGALAGLASWATGDLAGAHAAYTEAVDGLASDGSLADVLGCCITLGDIRRTQGRLTDAVRTYQWALGLRAPNPAAEPVRGSADMHVALADVSIERDDLRAAAEHLATSQRLGEHNGLPQNPYRWRMVTARLRETEGDLDGALELIEQADRVYAGDFSPNVRPVPAMRARLFIRCGELTEASLWAQQRQLSATDELSYLQEYEHITLARLLLARYRSDRDRPVIEDALGLLERLLAVAEDGARAGNVMELLVLLAIAEQSRRNDTAALAALQRAVTLAEPEGYVRLFADEGAPMAALLRTLIKQSASAGYLRRLLAATAKTAPHVAGTQRQFDTLSERELDVLRLLGTDLGGPEIARQLSVSLNTVRTHTKNIYAKLGVTSRRAAVRQGHELELLGRHRRG
jgi:LuxR family maltose regulon positive regulatory protein